MSNVFRCPSHGTLLSASTPHGCGWCVVDLRCRPDPTTMAPSDRAAEMDALINGPSTTRLSPIHRRVEALVGRPVLTHEIATTDLVAEAADWSRRGGWETRAIEGLCDRVGAERVIVVGDGG